MDKTLQLKFHGKILDQLGFQTYQSPVASLSELVANAWDADASSVNITLPNDSTQSDQITIEDDGVGMAFDECQERYLNIGYDRRSGDPFAKTTGGRSVMGRKGIGKFAGFGIAAKIRIDTTSSKTGENTVFEMEIDKLRADEYIKEGGEILASVTPADKSSHGTKVILKGLSLGRRISEKQFSMSLARRFLIQQTLDDFKVSVNGKPIPGTEDVSKVEFTFPGDYSESKKPEGLGVDDGGWGVEKLPNGKEIRWKFHFSKETIGDEDLRGITIFANRKLAQKPFFFNLSGGLGGQAGQSYMFGRVVADYVDQMKTDPISAERQRVNWELKETAPLLEWGQERVKKLLVIWHDLRGEKKRRLLEEKVSGFSDRLEKLGSHERKTIKNVLKKLGGISSISQQKYEEVADSILTTWEGGRLKELWTSIAESEGLEESDFLEILMETDIISALNVAEAIKTKLHAISELKARIDRKELERAVRDHLAENPWIISPKWDTFRIETRVNLLVRDCARESGLLDEKYKGRTDLVLSSGDHLLVLEFMRPGLALDWDHLGRCNRYVKSIRTAIEAHTQLEFTQVSGYIVADKLDKNPSIVTEIKDMKQHDIVVNDWGGLLNTAKSSWSDYLHILVKRGKGDPRLENLLED